MKKLSIIISELILKRGGHARKYERLLKFAKKYNIGVQKKEKVMNKKKLGKMMIGGIDIVNWNIKL